jgi:hypothetical protein
MNREKITEDINKISSVLRVHGIVVLPLEEITNNLSEVEERCPKTKEFIEKQIGRLMKYGGQTKSSA